MIDVNLTVHKMAGTFGDIVSMLVWEGNLIVATRYAVFKYDEKDKEFKIMRFDSIHPKYVDAGV